MNTERSAGGPVAQLLRSLAAFLRRGSPRPPDSSTTRVLVVVEGPNDIEFLRRISALLHHDDPRLPDLADMERQHALVFAPTGGVELSSAFRFAGLQVPEFHLLDRDLPPVTQTRHQIAEMVNSRPRCRAAVTFKRSLESYLHSSSIFEASGVSVQFSDDDDVPALVAHAVNERREPGVCWDELPARARKRLRYKAKRWLNTLAVDRMTPARLKERDPKGEVRSWLKAIAALARR